MSVPQQKIRSKNRSFDSSSVLRYSEKLPHNQILSSSKRISINLQSILNTKKTFQINPSNLQSLNTYYNDKDDTSKFIQKMENMNLNFTELNDKFIMGEKAQIKLKENMFKNLVSQVNICIEEIERLNEKLNEKKENEKSAIDQLVKDHKDSMHLKMQTIKNLETMLIKRKLSEEKLKQSVQSYKRQITFYRDKLKLELKARKDEHLDDSSNIDYANNINNINGDNGNNRNFYYINNNCNNMRTSININNSNYCNYGKSLPISTINENEENEFIKNKKMSYSIEKEDKKYIQTEANSHINFSKMNNSFNLNKENNNSFRRIHKRKLNAFINISNTDNNSINNMNNSNNISDISPVSHQIGIKKNKVININNNNNNITVNKRKTNNIGVKPKRIASSKLDSSFKGEIHKKKTENLHNSTKQIKKLKPDNIKSLNNSNKKETNNTNISSQKNNSMNDDVNNENNNNSSINKDNNPNKTNEIINYFSNSSDINLNNTSELEQINNGNNNHNKDNINNNNNTNKNDNENDKKINFHLDLNIINNNNSLEQLEEIKTNQPKKRHSIFGVIDNPMKSWGGSMKQLDNNNQKKFKDEDKKDVFEKLTDNLQFDFDNQMKYLIEQENDIQRIIKIIDKSNSINEDQKNSKNNLNLILNNDI